MGDLQKMNQTETYICPVCTALVVKTYHVLCASELEIVKEEVGEW